MQKLRGLLRKLRRSKSSPSVTSKPPVNGNSGTNGHPVAGGPIKANGDRLTSESVPADSNAGPTTAPLEIEAKANDAPPANGTAGAQMNDTTSTSQDLVEGIATTSGDTPANPALQANEGAPLDHTPAKKSTLIVDGESQATITGSRVVMRATAPGARLDVALENRTDSNTVFAYITGQAIDDGNRLFLLRADGRTAYFPGSPSAETSPLAVDCAIRLGAPGTTRTVSIPHLAGARIWFSVDNPLTFRLNPGPALVEPSVTNLSDPNINIQWDFAEFTFNSGQLFANITYVDFVSLPISLTLRNTAGATQHVSGMNPNGLDTVCNALQAQSAQDSANWRDLIVTGNNGNLRALSPNNGMIINPGLFDNYFTPYVDQVWSHYSNQDLTINTQAQWGKVIGRVNNDVLNLGGVTFTRPTTRDIFSCSTGTFAERSPEHGALTARLSAAFNRSTLLVNSHVPGPLGIGRSYYKAEITNHYARIVHHANLDGRGYAFPYDDVAPVGGKDMSGAVNDPNPDLFTVAVGGSGATK